MGATLLVGASSLVALPAFAGNTTMQLIKMMRDNGSITQAQYKQLKASAVQGRQPTQGQEQSGQSRNAGRVYKPQAVSNKPNNHFVKTQFGKTTLSGKTYVDGSWIDSSHETANGNKSNANDGYGFNVKRFYLTFDQQFNKTFSARFRTDIETGDSVAHPNEYNVYVKNAFVQAKFSKAFALRAGVADLPWVPYVEHLYGYRYVEKILIDRAHFGTSADLGLHALGKLANGTIDYQLSVVNGGGYHDVQRSSDVDVTGRIGFHPIEHTTFALGAREGRLGQNTANDGVTRRASRYDAVAAWVSDNVRYGVDGFYANNYDGGIVSGDKPSDSAYGVSGWASYTLPVYERKFSLFGRYDYVKPHDDTNSGQDDNFFTVGMQYQPVEPLKVSLLYKRDQINQGSGTFLNDQGQSSGTDFNASNIQATGVPGQDATYNEVGVFAQYVF